MKQFEPYDEGETRLSYELAWMAAMREGTYDVSSEMEWSGYPHKIVVWMLVELFKDRETKNN